VLLPALLFLAAALRAQAPDLILHHGKIVTVDPRFRIVDSIAIRGDRILAVGDYSEIAHLAGRDTRQID
jgi:predicted amidohydrolase YtcJ